jgi:hypothetical protein
MSVPVLATPCAVARLGGYGVRQFPVFILVMPDEVLVAATIPRLTTMALGITNPQ